jgi:hypothetical protein
MQSKEEGKQWKKLYISPSYVGRVFVYFFHIAKSKYIYNIVEYKKFCLRYLKKKNFILFVLLLLNCYF